jgi:hypothetical protein
MMPNISSVRRHSRGVSDARNRAMRPGAWAGLVMVTEFLTVDGTGRRPFERQIASWPQLQIVRK